MDEVDFYLEDLKNNGLVMFLYRKWENSLNVMKKQ